MVPLWSPNLISFCFISPLENVFLTSIYRLYLLIFDLSIFFNLTDGWMGDGWWVMGDGWVMDGWVPKMFFDFTQNFFRWSSDDINVRKFRTSAKKFLYRKKIQLQFSKIGGFLVEKKVLWFLSNFCQMKLRWYKCAPNSFVVTSCL